MTQCMHEVGCSNCSHCVGWAGHASCRGQLQAETGDMLHRIHDMEARASDMR